MEIHNINYLRRYDMDWIWHNAVWIRLVWSGLIALGILFFMGASNRRYGDRDYLPDICDQLNDKEGDNG